jgi:hypothetical protein
MQDLVDKFGAEANEGRKVALQEKIKRMERWHSTFIATVPLYRKHQESAIHLRADSFADDMLDSSL